VAAGLRGLSKTLLVSKEDFWKCSCRDAKDRVSSSPCGPTQGGLKEEVVKAIFWGASSSIHGPAMPGMRFGVEKEIFIRLPKPEPPGR